MRLILFINQQRKTNYLNLLQNSFSLQNHLSQPHNYKPISFGALTIALTCVALEYSENGHQENSLVLATLYALYYSIKLYGLCSPLFVLIGMQFINH
jgi:hypothetical protein